MIVQTKFKYLKNDTLFTVYVNGQGTDYVKLNSKVAEYCPVRINADQRIPGDTLVTADDCRIRTFWQRVFGRNK